MAGVRLSPCKNAETRMRRQHERGVVETHLIGDYPLSDAEPLTLCAVHVLDANLIPCCPAVWAKVPVVGNNADDCKHKSGFAALRTTACE